jgi:hypothetical protein
MLEGEKSQYPHIAGIALYFLDRKWVQKLAFCLPFPRFSSPCDGKVEVWGIVKK